MSSLAELERDNRRLKAQREVKEEFKERNKKKAMLLRENSALRNPKRTAFLRGLSKGGKLVAKEVGMVGRKIITTPRKKTKKGKVWKVPRLF